MKIATSSATATSERSPPESSDSRLIFLPGGRASTSRPVVSMLRRVGEDEPPLTAGEEPLEDPLELDRGVLEGLGEDALDALVDLLDDVEQVALGVLEVLELLGEELVTLLEGRELLEGERVDAPQRVQLALGLAQPLLLGLTHERAPGRAAARRGPRRGRAPSGTSWCGPYSSTRSAGAMPSSSTAFVSSCSMRRRCWVRATSSRCTRVGQPRSSACSDRDVAAHDGELGVTLGALGLAAPHGRARPASADSASSAWRPRRRGAHGLGDRGLTLSTRPLLGEPRGGSPPRGGHCARARRRGP